MFREKQLDAYGASVRNISLFVSHTHTLTSQISTADKNDGAQAAIQEAGGVALLEEAAAVTNANSQAAKFARKALECFGVKQLSMSPAADLTQSPYGSFPPISPGPTGISLFILKKRRLLCSLMSVLPCRCVPCIIQPVH